MTLGDSIAVDEALLVLKALFLVLLYLFIWRIVRSASKDVRLPQESFILGPDSAALTIGRGGQNDVPLEEDEFTSARHARFEPRRDGVWVQDRGSTNGTFVNGTQIDRPRRLAPGDVVRVGETDLRYDR